MRRDVLGEALALIDEVRDRTKGVPTEDEMSRLRDRVEMLAGLHERPPLFRAVVGEPLYFLARGL